MMSIATRSSSSVNLERRSCQTRWSARSLLRVRVASKPGSSSSAMPRLDGAVWPWSW